MVKKRIRSLSRSTGLADVLYTSIAVCFSLAVAAAVLLPLLNFVALSVSGRDAVVRQSVFALPIDPTLEAYQYVLRGKDFFRALRVSALVTVVGSAIGVASTVLAAYALSKPWLKGRKALTIAFIFPIMFNAGIIPNYMVVRNLGLVNTVWALILPLAIDIFSLLIAKNYMESLPAAIEESASIDGASVFQTLRLIVLPICKPMIAAIFLFFAVNYWNNFFLAKFYITDRVLTTLQVFMQEVIFEVADPTGLFTMDVSQQSRVHPQSIVNATVALVMLPMVVVYPFVQRFFVKGIVVGSVKG